VGYCFGEIGTKPGPSPSDRDGVVNISLDIGYAAATAGRIFGFVALTIEKGPPGLKKKNNVG